MSDMFTSELWPGITEIYRAILAPPFLIGLTDGRPPYDACACTGTSAGQAVTNGCSGTWATGRKAGRSKIVFRVSITIRGGVAM
jgi:hypothetical protein